jgi:diphthine-ammonia ligase
MILGILFSGGKDSTYALLKATEGNDVACLITLVSSNKESYMFHTPNIDVTSVQAEAMGLPIVTVKTEGKKEDELEDLKAAIVNAKEEFQIEGIVTGAVESVYQSERIQKICSDLDLWCFNPLWKKDQEELLRELLKEKFRVIISGIFAYPLDEKWLGKEIDDKMIGELVDLKKKYGLSPSGEGGELETTVIDAPFFERRIEILQSEKSSKDNSGVFIIKKLKLVKK